MTVVLLDKTFGPELDRTGRTLVLEGGCLVVKTGCCDAKFEADNDKRMMICSLCRFHLEPMPAHGSRFTPVIPIDTFRNRQPSQDIWSEWFEYWFKVPDVTFEVTWEEE